MKGHQNNPQTLRIFYRNGTAHPGSEIPRSTTERYDIISPKLTFEAVNAVDMCKFAPIHRDGDDFV